MWSVLGFFAAWFAISILAGLGMAKWFRGLPDDDE